jgi:hypothetical protein
MAKIILSAELQDPKKAQHTMEVKMAATIK